MKEKRAEETNAKKKGGIGKRENRCKEKLYHGSNTKFEYISEIKNIFKPLSNLILKNI